jgi:hypothetical protein
MIFEPQMYLIWMIAISHLLRRFTKQWFQRREIKSLDIFTEPSSGKEREAGERSYGRTSRKS